MSKLIVTLSQARTGSNAFLELVASTGVGWMPEIMSPFAKYTDDSSPEALKRSVLEEMRKYRTEVGLVTKMTYRWWRMRCNHVQIDKDSEIQFFNQLFDPNTKFVLLRRKDKIAQAVSSFCADKTRKWTSIDKSKRRLSTKDYNFKQIKKTLRWFHNMESNWACITRYIHFLPLFYEDIFGDDQDRWLKILSKHLDLEIKPIEHKKFFKTTTPIQKEFEVKFRKEYANR